MCSWRVAERGRYSHKHRAPTGLERTFIRLKLIHCLLLGFFLFFSKSISGNVSGFFLPLGAHHEPNITNNCPALRRQRCTRSPTCVPQATRVTSLPSCKTSAWDRGMVYASTGTCSTAEEHTGSVSDTATLPRRSCANTPPNKLGNTFINHLMDGPVAFVPYIQIEILREQ